MPHDPNPLLTQLEAAKSNFATGHATQIVNLLHQLASLALNDPHQLIRFHECLLFLRAFPHAASQVSRVERLLNTFHQRIEKLRVANRDMSLFDDFDTSGIAGTTMQDTLSFDVARWLVSRIPRNVDIAWDDYWDDYQAERARGTTWPRFIPLLEEDADVEANIPWSNWLDAATGTGPVIPNRATGITDPVNPNRTTGITDPVIPNRAARPVRACPELAEGNLLSNPLPWLLNRFAQLPLPARQSSELYDSLRLPIRWELENLKLSRTRNWSSPRRFYFHNAPFIQRSQVSLAHELAQPAPKLEKLSRVAGERVMQHIREIMAVRYRELYGTTLGDPRTVVRADLGRGVVMHFWGLPPQRRLPLRAYVAGYTLKNGVPINYVEAIGLCEWIEVGFNTFYTYRQGETAWIYAQALRCLCALMHAKCISIYPYQIGQNNDEAIDSGAFWFYRKLGFRPGRPDLQELCEREEKRIAINPHYRTPPRTLKRLAEAHMFYEGFVSGHAGTRSIDLALKGRGFSRALETSKLNPASAAEATPGPWDTFSTRNLGLQINRRMAREFHGDARKIRHSSTATVSRALKINPTRWTPDQKQSLQNWSPVLALIPNLTRWTPDEKHQLIKIIRAKSARNEMLYLHQTQRHARLRAALLRLGS